MYWLGANLSGSLVVRLDLRTGVVAANGDGRVEFWLIKCFSASPKAILRTSGEIGGVPGILRGRPRRFLVGSGVLPNNSSVSKVGRLLDRVSVESAVASASAKTVSSLNDGDNGRLTSA